MHHRRTLLIALAAILTLPGGCTSRSDDSVTGLFVPAKPGSSSPRMSFRAESRPILSWTEADTDGHSLWFSVLGDSGWQTPRAVVSGRDMFVNWADLPAVIEVSGEHWVAHWLEMAGDTTYAYHVMIAQSFNGGHTWSNPVKPHADDSPTEHGFVSFFPSGRGVAAVWLDGRKTINEADGNPRTDSMTLRTAAIDSSGFLYDETEIDDLVCDCCQTDATLTSNGPLVLYRDRSEDEIRDIRVARRTSTGWKSGQTLHDDGWKIGGCPVNGPAVAASGSQVAAAWFTAAFKHPRVKLKFSRDGGDTFDDAIEVASAGSLGHVDTLLLHDGTAIVSWLESKDGLARLRMRRFGDGTWSFAMTVAEDVYPRSVPQLALDGERIVVAWTARQGDQRRIRSATVHTNQLAVK